MKMNITIVDPKVNPEEVAKNTSLLPLSCIPSSKKFTIIILALYHEEFKELTKEKLSKFALKGTLIFDLTNNLEGEDIINL